MEYSYFKQRISIKRLKGTRRNSKLKSVITEMKRPISGISRRLSSQKEQEPLRRATWGLPWLRDKKMKIKINEPWLGHKGKHHCTRVLGKVEEVITESV